MISRAIQKTISNISIEKSYLQLAQNFKNTLCYLLISDYGIWMGATPEILGKFNKKTSEFFTMSLAGTLPLQEEWSEKEIEEQKPVKMCIRDRCKWRP